MLRRLFNAYQCDDQGRARRRLQAWYRLRLGRLLGELEQQELQTVLTTLFGYHLLQVGSPFGTEALEASRINHRVVLERTPGRSRVPPEQSRLKGEADALPFCSSSLDVVVLPHTLEFERHPHQILRETDRVLVPEGHVVLVGYSPWSLLGVARLLLGWRGEPPWCGHFYSARRLTDWLELLGFDTVLVRGYFYRPPFIPRGIMRRLGFFERLGRRWWPLFGGGYILVARKRVITLTPIRPRWRARRRMLPTGATPSTRSRID